MLIFVHNFTALHHSCVAAEPVASEQCELLSVKMNRYLINEAVEFG